MHSKKQPAISLSWKEGRYFDAWSLVHVLSGATLGAGLMLFAIPVTWAFAAAVVLMVLWELFEIYVGIGESVQNLFTDIIVGAIGFAISAEFLPEAREDHIVVFIVLLVVNVFFAFAGWRAFVARTGETVAKPIKEKHKEIYKKIR